MSSEGSTIFPVTGHLNVLVGSVTYGLGLQVVRLQIKPDPPNHHLGPGRQSVLAVPDVSCLGIS